MGDFLYIEEKDRPKNFSIEKIFAYFDIKQTIILQNKKTSKKLKFILPILNFFIII